MHPEYRERIHDWSRWRSTYDSGRQFINRFLEQYTKRESVADFKCRKNMSYCPAFAASAVNDVKNSIYQRMMDIQRIGGPDNYIQALKGRNGGVDLKGSSMNKFMGQEILTELLVLGKVGIYVDMPALSGETLAQTYKNRPYVYSYKAEDIRSWCTETDAEGAYFTNILLRDYIYETDEETGLVASTSTQYRRLWLDPNGEGVWYQIIPGGKESQSADLATIPKELLVGMKRIPFILLELSESLMTNICDYQIALLNLDSSDLAYLYKSNFPFYVEEYEPRSDYVGASGRMVNGDVAGDNPDDAKAQEITIGNTSGRRYPKGMKPPQFIAPPSEPMTVSMAKQEQMKNEIRHLLNLTLSNIEPKFASAESKNMDQRSLESGLSAIGLTMEYGERELAKVWNDYLGTLKKVPAEINYPQLYTLKTDDTRRAEADQLSKLIPAAPSITYKKEMSKKIAVTMLEHSVPQETLDKIKEEIDNAPYVDGSGVDVVADLEAGIVTEETASLARGYDPDKEITKARQQHSDRLARVAKAQISPTQGNPDTKPVNPTNPGAGRPPVAGGSN